MLKLIVFLLIALRALPLSADNTPTASFDIVASKPVDGWLWNANIENLYDISQYSTNSKSVAGTTIASGGEITLSIQNFPDSSSGDYEDLFKVKFESESAGKVSLDIKMYPFSAEDSSINLPVQYKMVENRSYSHPSNYTPNGFSVGNNQTFYVTVENSAGKSQNVNVLNNSSIVSFLDGNSGKIGLFSYELTVSARFDGSQDGDTVNSHRWTLPIEVTLTVGGE